MNLFVKNNDKRISEKIMRKVQDLDFEPDLKF